MIKPEYINGIPQITWKIYEDEYYDTHLLHEVIEKWAEEKPNDIAFYSVNTEQEFTWKQFNENAEAIAYKLIDMGIKKGDFIATSLPFLPEHIFLEYGAFKIGAIIAPLDIRLKPTEAIRNLNQIKPKIYAHLGKTDFADFDKMAEIIRDNVDYIDYFIQFSDPDSCIEEETNAKILSAWVFGREAESLAKDVKIGKRDDLLKKYKEMKKAVKEEDGAMVIYTTGSTGFPKAALLSHRGIIVQCITLGWGFKFNNDKEIMLVNLPPSHVGGQTEQLMATWFFGAKCVVLDLYKPDLSLEAIQKYKVTLVGQIPALFNLQWRLPNYETYDLSSIKLTLYSGQSVSRQFLEKMKKMAPQFSTGLGLTELCGMCTYTRLDGTVDDILSGIGYDMPITPISIRGKMKEDGSAGDEMAKGEIGQICFSGPQVFIGYVNDEENTKKTISTDGWCYTGDVGFYDDDGLHFAGRSKLMIKPKGYNVYPPEVENFISDALKTKVENVAVVGHKHEIFGEGIIAYVEQKKGEEITVEEVKAICKDIAAYKRPSHIVIVRYNDMPLNRSQKVDYVDLKLRCNKDIKALREKGGWDAN